MSQFGEYIKIAIMNIRHNKGRSILTMLGIIIGISSVIMVLSIGGGVRSEINDELNSIAGGQVAVYVDTTRKDTTIRFTHEDLDALRSIDHVKGASESYGEWGTATGPKGSADLRISCGNADMKYDGKDPIIYGRFFDENDYESGNLVAVINESSAKMLFGTTNVVGLTFEGDLYGVSQEIKVIGVKKDPAGAFASIVNGSGYVLAQMPTTAMEYKYGFYYGEISQVYVYTEGNEFCAEAAKQAKMILENRHNVVGENQVLIQSFTDATAQYDTILGVITLFVSFVAAISLLVGGIGVMNIMLVSVTERTREIGIRKSLGARTGSIMMQFLAEAGIITLIGGAIGISFGILGALAVCAALKMKATISVGTIVIATVFSCGIGVFFGIYPAKKAAKLRPIEALRHE